MDLNKRRVFIINIAYWAIILAIMYLFFKYLINLAMPFILALVFSSILRPVVRFLNKKCRIRYNIAAILCPLLFFAIIGGLGVLFLARMASGAADLISSLPKVYTTAIEPGLQNLMENIQDFASRFDPAVVEMVESLTPELISTIGNTVSRFSMSAVSALSGIAAKLPGALLDCVICIIATVFMSVDYDRMAAFIMRQLPDRAKKLAIDIKDSLYRVILRYGKSYLLILFITFLEIAIGLLIIGIRKAVLIALLIAIFDIFPIVGAGLVLVTWAIITFIQGNVARGLGLSLLYIIVVVVRQIIEPRIIGKHVGLHPLITLICMFVGGSLFGAVGILAVPLTAAIIQNLNSSGAIRLFKTLDGDGKEPKTKGKKTRYPPEEASRTENAAE